ncbi:MAG: Sir2 family NAD-dependent protein deacetylase [Chloroflexi bacterium]|nr:Sir2 family NAD-dependent protein deacetylase [Chloroflexota bacterium]
MTALARLIGNARRLLVFTGAGASADSGIPTYRGGSGAAERPTIAEADRPGTVWDRHTPLTYRQFMAGAAERRLYWQRSRHTWPVVRDARPHAGHQAVAALDWRGLLDCVVTQNIDELHQRGGVTTDRVIELHGTAHAVRCLACGAHSDRGAVQARVEAGDLPPACRGCGGVLKPATVLFGEPLPPGRLALASDRARACDVCLVVGSSLTVQPAASIPRYAVTQGARLAIVNPEPTWLDARADVVVRGRAAPVLAAVASVLAG